MSQSIRAANPIGLDGHDRCPPRRPSADICAHLARHGVRAQASSTVLGPEAEAVSSALRTVGDFGSQQRGPWTQFRHPALAKADVGNALLSAAADCAADLLVMGAYRHSRVRELVLGGATRENLARSYYCRWAESDCDIVGLPPSNGPVFRKQAITAFHAANTAGVSSKFCLKTLMRNSGVRETAQYRAWITRGLETFLVGLTGAINKGTSAFPSAINTCVFATPAGLCGNRRK